MKNTIKIIIILGVAASFSPLYSMTVRSSEIRDVMDATYYYLKKSDLKKIDPLSNISKLPICSGSANETNSALIADCNSLSIDEEGLVLRLAVIKWFFENSKENDPNFEKIFAALDQGGPIASKHTLKLSLGDEDIIIFSNQKRTTMLEDIKNFRKVKLIGNSEMFRDLQEKIARPSEIETDGRTQELKRCEEAAETVLYMDIMKNQKICRLMYAVINNENNRKKGLICIKEELAKIKIKKEELAKIKIKKTVVPSDLILLLCSLFSKIKIKKTAVPSDLILLLCSFFSENDDEVTTALVEEGNRKFSGYCYLALPST